MITTKLKQAGAFFSLEKEYLPDKKVNTKADKENNNQKMTVITASTGREFNANPMARINVLSALFAGPFLGKVTTDWELADDSKVTVTIDELNEVNALALQKYGALLGIKEI